MKTIIAEITMKFLLMLVRTFFGIFIGGFFGTVVGVLVAVLISLDKGNSQLIMAEIMGTFLVIGAILGALVGASNLLASKANNKPKSGDLAEDNWYSNNDSEHGNHAGNDGHAGSSRE